MRWVSEFLEPEWFGLPIAVALGTLIGKSAYGLEVLRDLTPEALAEGKQVIEDKRIHIALRIMSTSSISK